MSAPEGTKFAKSVRDARSSNNQYGCAEISHTWQTCHFTNAVPRIDLEAAT